MNIIAYMERLAYGGATIGTIREGDPTLIGKKIFLPFSIPGETVEAEMVSSSARFVEGKVLSILQSSPDRVAPPCPHFSSCGGCDLQHIAHHQQRVLKREMVALTLKHQGKLTPTEGVESVDNELPFTHYRSRITVHLNKEGELGFYRPQSGSVVPITSCLLARPVLNTLLASLTPLAPSLAPFIGGMTLEERASSAYLLLILREDLPPQEIPSSLLASLQVVTPEIDISYRKKVLTSYRSSNGDSHPIGHFSQVNQLGNAALHSLVLNEFTSSKKVLDLYAGAGNFSIPLAQHGCTVTAVENDPALVEEGNRRAAELALSNRITFVQSSCQQYIKKHSPPESVLLDPPRSGAKEIIPFLTKSSVHKIVYISCNLPSLTRDLALLKQSGFKVQKVYVVDMFAQTHHVECVAILQTY